MERRKISAILAICIICVSRRLRYMKTPTLVILMQMSSSMSLQKNNGKVLIFQTIPLRRHSHQQNTGNYLPVLMNCFPIHIHDPNLTLQQVLNIITIMGNMISLQSIRKLIWSDTSLWKTTTLMLPTSRTTTFGGQTLTIN